jgi:hypothetical protein
MGILVIPSAGIEIQQDGIELLVEVNGDGASYVRRDIEGGAKILQIGVGPRDSFASNVALLAMLLAFD